MPIDVARSNEGGEVVPGLAESLMKAFLKETPHQSFYQSALSAALLASLHPKVEGQWYYNQEIALDGYQFSRCRFENCRITISKGAFRLTNCLFTGCKFLFTGDAVHVVKISTLADLANLPPSLRPLIYQDRTVTI